MPVVFISQPMTGIPLEEQRSVRMEAEALLHKHEYVPILTNWSEQPNTPNDDLHYLGEAICSMSYADTIFMCDGWEKSKGCTIVHTIAEQYGLKVITKEDLQ